MTSMAPLPGASRGLAGRYPFEAEDVVGSPELCCPGAARAATGRLPQRLGMPSEGGGKEVAVVSMVFWGGKMG